MNSQEFVLWLKGFTEGVHEFNVTPKQWDLLKERLAEVEEDEEFEETPGMFEVHREPPYPGTSIGPYGTGTPNHDLVQRHPWGSPIVWGRSGTAGDPIDCTTSGYLSASYINGSGTTTSYPANTTVTYTTNKDVPSTLTFKKEDGATWYTLTTSEDLLNYKSTKIENNSGNK